MTPNGSISASYANVEFFQIPEAYKVPQTSRHKKTNSMISIVDVKHGLLHNVDKPMLSSQGRSLTMDQ